MSSLLRDKASKLVPVGCNPDDWMNEHVDAGDFTGCTSVLLAFRVVGSKAKEHPINFGAALATRTRADVFPGGKMCHAELILPVSEGVYCKNSVAKKVYNGQDAAGKDQYKPGCVYCKLTHPSEWKSKYVFLSFETKRKHILKALRFCILNNGMGFNQRGFNANLFIPGGLGVRRWHDGLMTTRREYFCTEFIVTALLAMLSEDRREQHPAHWKNVILTMNPATSNPNSLYRVMKLAVGVFDKVPLGKMLAV
jgi:hypothetical protein